MAAPSFHPAALIQRWLLASTDSSPTAQAFAHGLQGVLLPAVVQCDQQMNAVLQTQEQLSLLIDKLASGRCLAVCPTQRRSTHFKTKQASNVGRPRRRRLAPCNRCHQFRGLHLHCSPIQKASQGLCRPSISGTSVIRSSKFCDSSFLGFNVFVIRSSALVYLGGPFQFFSRSPASF